MLLWKHSSAHIYNDLETICKWKLKTNWFPLFFPSRPDPFKKQGEVIQWNNKNLKILIFVGSNLSSNFCYCGKTITFHAYYTDFVISYQQSFRRSPILDRTLSNRRCRTVRWNTRNIKLSEETSTSSFSIVADCSDAPRDTHEAKKVFLLPLIGGWWRIREYELALSMFFNFPKMETSPDKRRLVSTFKEYLEREMNHKIYQNIQKNEWKKEKYS